MDGLAHLVDDTIHPLQPLIVLVALIGWVIAAISMIRSRLTHKEKYASPAFIVGLIIFVGVIGAEFAVYDFVIREALNDEIKPQLAGKIESVTVNGNPLDNSGPLITALREMHGTIGHHSHTTTRYRVVLTTSRGTLPLDLNRDSQDPHEYWVYYPSFHITKLKEVGHAFTDTLDGM